MREPAGPKGPGKAGGDAGMEKGEGEAGRGGGERRGGAGGEQLRLREPLLVVDTMELNTMDSPFRSARA